MAKPDQRCYINNTNKYLFINIPKNASTSLRHAIKFDGMVKYNEIKNSGEFLKFIVIRNPIHRVISSFLEIRKLRGDGPFNITQTSAWFKEPNIKKSFDMFLEFIDGNFYDPHAEPQIKFLTCKGLTIDDMDFKILHSEITSGYEELVSKYQQIKTIKPLPTMQVGDGGIKKIINDYVNSHQSTQTRIKEIYSEDFELYYSILG